MLFTLKSPLSHNKMHNFLLDMLPVSYFSSDLSPTYYLLPVLKICLEFVSIQRVLRWQILLLFICNSLEIKKDSYPMFNLVFLIKWLLVIRSVKFWFYTIIKSQSMTTNQTLSGIFHTIEIQTQQESYYIKQSFSVIFI